MFYAKVKYENNLFYLACFLQSIKMNTPSKRGLFTYYFLSKFKTVHFLDQVRR